MTAGLKIVVIDDGFLGKYIVRELSGRYSGFDDEVVAIHLSDYSESTVCDIVVDATGSIEVFPRSCRLTVSLGSVPSANAAVRYALAAVVGTGMGGPLMEMARAISRGTYYHLKGDQTRLPVVHAVDVARAVALAAGGACVPGDYYLSDGRQPLVSDIAEGLAFRLGQKRIYTLPPKWMKLMAFAGLAKQIEFQSPDISQTLVSLADAVEEWRPVDTVEYLKTHDYGNDAF